MINEKMPKNAKIFYCEKCNFKCSKMSNWSKHLLTSKHKNGNNGSIRVIHDNGKNATATFRCDCGKEYIHSSGLSRHKKKCQKMPKNAENYNNVVTE